MVFQNVGLLWLIDNNKNYTFETDLEDKVPQYNTIISTKLNGQRLEDYFKTGRKDRYYLMCDVDAYAKEHVLIPDDESSGGVIPMSSTSSK